MMQKGTVQAISVKEGDNDKGHWINTIITLMDGAKVGTFEHSAKGLKQGDEVEFEPELKGNRVNVKAGTLKVKTQSLEAPTAPRQNGGGGYKRDIEALIMERDSIEAQTAYKGIIDLMVAGMPIEADLVIAATNWAKAKLRLPPQKQAPEKHDAKPKAAQDDKPFPNVWAFLGWCLEAMDLNRSEVLKVLNIKEKDLPNLDLLWAKATVEDYRKQNPKLVEEGN